MQSEDPAPRTRASARLVAAWATAGFVLLQLAWVLVMPPATGIDEFDQAYKASAVANGHWRPAETRVPSLLGRGGFIPVRADIVEAAGPACARLPYTGPFNCRPFRQLGHGMVEVACADDNYNPAFYVVVGLASRPFTGNSALYAMRITGAALCAGAFFLAVYLTMLWARTRWPLVTVLLAMLPTTVYSSIVAAPNGLHMMNGLVAWTSLAGLARGGRQARTAAYAGLMGAAAVMATTHTLGILWLGLIALSGVAYLGIRGAVALLRPRTRGEWIWLVVALTGVAFEICWLLYARPNDPSHPDFGMPGSPWPAIAPSLLLWPLQAIAAFPFRNEPAPTTVYAIALVLLGAMVALTVRALRGQRALARTASVIMFWTVLLPIVMTALTYHQIGPAWQGRYGMPLAVGLFVVSALALDGHGSTVGPLLMVGTVFWISAQVLGLLDVLGQQRKDHVLAAATGWWDPPGVIIVGLGLLACAAWLRALAGTGPAFRLTRVPPNA